MNTHAPLESLAARAWGRRVYTASAPESPQYHPRGGLSGPGIRRYLGNKLSKPKTMATNRPPLLPCSRAAFPLGFPSLCLSFVCISVGTAASPPELGQAAAVPHSDSSDIVGLVPSQDK